MTRVTAVVTLTRDEASGPVDHEVVVHSLDELYAACKTAPPSDLVQVHLHGDAGVVLLNFGSFAHPHP